MANQYVSVDGGWELVDDDSPTVPMRRPSYAELAASLRDSQASLRTSSDRAIKVAEQCHKKGSDR